MKKAWFSIYDFSFNYPGSEPPFIDPSPFGWAKDIATNTEAIKKELGTYLNAHNLQGYFNTSMVSKPNSWRTIALKTWSVELYKNQAHFPVTTALINKYPQIVSASFNLLEPQSKILPHCGDTNAIYRCHLGLDVPAGLPDCGFRVKEETRAWQNGQWLIFMDAYNHEAWNNTNQERYIFLIDVMRDEFKSRRNRVCSTVLASLFLQKRFDKRKFFKNRPPAFIKLLAGILQPMALLSTKLSNALKVY